MNLTPMKVAFSFIFSITIVSGCVMPANENGGSGSDDDEWNEELPAHFYDQQKDYADAYVTDLRDPTKKDFEEGKDEREIRTFKRFGMRYNLLRADDVLLLPKELSDINGLSLSPDGYSLNAINYRDGELHYFNRWDGALERSVRFKRRGKYKGIEAVRNAVFVVKENGTIVHISELESDKPDTETFNTPLNAKYKVQGMTYNPIQNELLLVCQGNGGDDVFDDSKSIYVFDLDSKELLRQPMFLIEDQDIVDYLNYFKPKQEGDELFYDLPSSKPFEPSAISIHPKTNDIYVVSAASMQLLILSEEGELLYVEQLDPFLFNHPEGMCFDDEAKLYISSKGSKGETGKVLIFSPQRTNRYPS